MNPKSCRFTRAAVAIFGQLQLRSRETTTPLLPTDLWAECERLHRLLSKAQQQRLRLAEQRLRVHLCKSMARLNEQLATSRRTMDRHPPSQTVSTAHEILADLRSLQGEFDDVSVNMKHRTITVRTDTIELEGVVLGQFDIVLDWRYLSESGTYDVIAVDGNPAATRVKTRRIRMCRAIRSAKETVRRPSETHCPKVACLISLFSFGRSWKPTTQPVPT